MDNKEIIKNLRSIAKLSEIQDVNQFKIRALNNAIFSLERAEKILKECSRDELEQIDGVGKSIAAQISQLIETGTCDLLDQLIKDTPPGVIEISRLPGVGAKKVKALWTELGVVSIDTLYDKIIHGELEKVKGFGKKTSSNILESIDFYRSQKGKLLYPRALGLGLSLVSRLKESFPESSWELTGALRRKCQVIDRIEILGVRKKQKALMFLKKAEDIELHPKESSPYILRATLVETGIPLWIRLAEEGEFANELFQTTGTSGHVEKIVRKLDGCAFSTEKIIYADAGLPVYPPEIRENETPDDLSDEVISNLVTENSIKGILHAHSTYSDGKHSLEQMVKAAIKSGFEYLGITDHSKSSFFYANGLYENRIRDQHGEIEEINKKYPDFKLFKGIECDILTDGSLDYEDEVLDSFDFIVCSVHSVLSMDADTATKRLLRAIENPFTTILGHMTGRLLIRRPGFPLYMDYILDACEKNNVVIELNANPNRLDVDWHWIPRILERNIKISINPDAHSIEAYSDIQYGVHQARKGLAGVSDNLTSLSAGDLDSFFKLRKEKALSRA